MAYLLMIYQAGHNGAMQGSGGVRRGRGGDGGVMLGSKEREIVEWWCRLRCVCAPAQVGFGMKCGTAGGKAEQVWRVYSPAQPHSLLFCHTTHATGPRVCRPHLFAIERIWRHIAEIAAFNDDHAWVLPQGPGQLAVAHINGVDPCGTVL